MNTHQGADHSVWQLLDKYYAGHTEVALLCIKHHKQLGACKYAVNYPYIPYVGLQQL